MFHIITHSSVYVGSFCVSSRLTMTEINPTESDCVNLLMRRCVHISIFVHTHKTCRHLAHRALPEADPVLSDYHDMTVLASGLREA